MQNDFLDLPYIDQQALSLCYSLNIIRLKIKYQTMRKLQRQANIKKILE